MTVKVTILGCGSSGGVPRLGNNWGACDPANPKNIRTRCSVLVEKSDETGERPTRVLIDTTPDLRGQLLAQNIGELDAVLYTHEHADHTHGIDELRVIALNMRKRVPVWANDRTGTMLLGRFGYCFYTPPGSDYPPILHLSRIEPHRLVTISGPGGDMQFLPFELLHGNIKALGFRVGGLAYTPDLNGVPDESLPALSNLDMWIVDALRPTPHPSHLSLDEALDWIARLKPARAVLTNMHIDLDYGALEASLPEGVVPAFDGMVLHVEESKMALTA